MTRNADSSAPPSDSWYASSLPSLSGCQASSVVLPDGSIRIGSISARSPPDAAAVYSTACSWPGVRRMKNRRVPRQAGVLTVPASSSSVSLAASGSRPGSAAMRSA